MPFLFTGISPMYLLRCSNRCYELHYLNIKNIRVGVMDAFIPYAIRQGLRDPYCFPSQVRLQCVVPYLVTLLGDAAAGVRSMALRCLVKVMCSISVSG